MKKIAAEGNDLVSHAIVLAGFEAQVVENIEVKAENGFRFCARFLILTVDERLRDGEKAIGDALHRRDNHSDLRCLGHGPDKTGGVEHAFGAEQRGAAKLKRDDGLAKMERFDRAAEPRA
jgi:hypothetical protein